MFEILAGSRPFPTLGDSLATLLQHAEEPPMSLADTVAGLPGEMVQLVDAMLAKTPEARPSLAAVRTVIKRLRTTQLPTHSFAGLAMAVVDPAPRQARARDHARRGSAPRRVVPGDSLAADRPRRDLAAADHDARGRHRLDAVLASEPPAHADAERGTAVAQGG